jgi:LysR family transcriptional regulator, hydrogen peroxide-inducible genes activator
MRLIHLRYFLTLCKELNFTRAARRCKVSQPSLSNAIRSLERKLGGQLINRNKPVSLTAFGKNVRPHLQRALTNIEKAKETAANQLYNGHGIRFDNAALRQDAPRDQL